MREGARFQRLLNEWENSLVSKVEFLAGRRSSTLAVDKSPAGVDEPDSVKGACGGKHDGQFERSLRLRTLSREKLIISQPRIDITVQVSLIGMPLNI